MKVLLRHVDGHTFVAKSDSNHWIPLDTGTASGGSGAANDPFQLFVIGLGGCTSVDVVDILRKARAHITRYELEVEGVRAETVPKILRAVHFHYRLDSDAKADAVRRAIELSLTKYCSAAQSLDRSVRFTAQLTLNGETGEAWEIPRNPDVYG